MSGSPWLDTLKDTVRERTVDTGETLEKTSEALLSERCESLAGEPTPVLDIPSTRTTHATRGENEERLLANGWTPKERGRLVIRDPLVHLLLRSASERS